MNHKKSLTQPLVGSSALKGALLIALLLGMLLLTAQPAQAQQEEAYKIQWRDYTFYTNKAMPVIPSALKIEAYPDTVEEGYYFVQFTDHVTKEMKAQVDSAGGKLFNYVPNNTYIVKMTAADRRRVQALPAVQWLGVFQPAMRLSSRLIRRIEGEEVEPPRKPYPFEFMKPDTVTEPLLLQVTVLVFKGEDLEKVSEDIARAGGTVLAAKEGKRRSKLRVTCPLEKVYDLARINGVMWIEEFKLNELHNNAAREIMNVGPVWSSPSGLTGSDQIVAISDGGLDSGVNDATMHDDIEGSIVSIFSWPVQVGYFGVTNSGADDGASDLNSGHGTHTTGSVLGDGTMSGGTFSGVAPDVSLVFQAIEQWTDYQGTSDDGYSLTGIPHDLNDLFQEAYDAGARIHSNSWGHSANGAYNDAAEEVDEFVWDHPDMLIIYSAGNSGVDADQNNVVDLGSVNPPGTAKNCLTVGASENSRLAVSNTWSSYYGPVIDSDPVADNSSGMAAFSGRGPANSNTASVTDDRIKPDLVAPGTMVASTRSQATPNTVWFTDDMESGLAGWAAQTPWAQVTTDAHSASTSWHDSPGGDYANNVNISLTSPSRNISGGGLGGKIIRFWSHYDLGTGDEWNLEASYDGGATWPGSVGPFTGTQTDWELLSIGLGGFSNSNNFRLRFRLQSNNDGVTGDGLYIDDVRIVEGAFGSSQLSDQGLAAVGSANDQNYLLMNGTSMATPLTAGCVALVRQYYMDEVGLDYVSAALLRATLINGAAEMSPGQYGTGANQEIGAKPNNVEGWGRVDLENSLFPPPPTVLDHIDELAGLEDGESRTYSLEIINNTVPIAITMVYHDYPGAGIQNNLNMTVTTPGGTTLFPNGLTATDPRNNVEQIRIPAPVTGTYTITIDAPNIQHGPQPYALVTSAGGTIVDREPVDVMLILDLSGSMLSAACPTCGPKLEVLIDAVELFVQLWTAVAAPNDRIGVTYFKTNVSEFDVGGDILLPVLPNAAGIIADVQSQSTISTNLTAMGGGLQSAINTLVDETRPRNIILFTNGMQNVNPMVLGDATSGLEIDNELGRTNSNINATVPPTELNMDLGIKVNTIGVGATDPFRELLDNIASETGGLSKFTTAPDDDLRRFYVEELIDVLREYSPQLLAYRYGNLINTTTIETFAVNNNARKVLLKLSWQRGDSLYFQVKKDGVDLTSAGKIVNGPFYSIYSVEVPVDLKDRTISPGGDWHMQINGAKGSSYEAAAIVDEPLLEYDFSIGRKDYVVGEPLELSVRLTFGRRPITDAERVTATVLKPQQGLGTLLSINPTPPEPRVFELESAATAGQRKLQLLLRDERFYHDLQPVGQTLILQNNGDGSYSTVFPNTEKTGTYTVIFQVEGERSDIGKYERTEILSTMVRFDKAERAASNLRLTLLEETAEGRSMLLSIRPKDRFGNYLGPDYGHRIKVSLSEGSVGTDKQDLVDGSYTIPLFIPPATDPVMTVTVMNQPVYKGRLSELVGYRFSVSIHSGTAIPTGTFATDFDPGFNVLLDVDYHFSPQFSLVGFFGYNAFKSKTTSVDDTYWMNLSANVRYQRLLTIPFSYYIGAGPGIYIPKDGDTEFGANVGCGFNYELNPRIAFELGADYHMIFDADIQFVHSHAGVIFKF